MLGLMLASVAMATLGWAVARAFYKDEAGARQAARGQSAALREPARVRLRQVPHRRALRGDVRARLPRPGRAPLPGSTTSWSTAWSRALAATTRAGGVADRRHRSPTSSTARSTASPTLLLGGGRALRARADRPHQQLRARRGGRRGAPDRPDELVVTENRHDLRSLLSDDARCRCTPSSLSFDGARRADADRAQRPSRRAGCALDRDRAWRRARAASRCTPTRGASLQPGESLRAARQLHARRAAHAGVRRACRSHAPPGDEIRARVAACARGGRRGC